MSQKPNLVEKLIGWIPGYKGYSERETRRDTDRLVRDAVTRSLEPARKTLDGAIAECSQSMKFEHLEALELVRRKLTTAMDSLKHAPGGYSGFFDTVKIDSGQLDEIIEHDLRMRDVAAKVAATCAALDAPDKSNLKAAKSAVDEFDASLRRRTDLLKGIEES